MKRRFNLFLLAVLVAMAFARSAKAMDYPEQTFDMSQEGYIDFSTPSGNIECLFTPQGTTSEQGEGTLLACDRNQPSYIRVILNGQGKAKIINGVEDPFCCGGKNVLDYGRSFVGDNIQCESSPSGLECLSDSGHGFHLSRAKVNVH